MCERSPGLPLLKGGLVCRSNPLDLFTGSVADIRGFIPLSDQQNKGIARLSGGFGAPEVNLGSHGNTGTNDLCPVGEASRTGTGPGSAVRVATSAVRRKVRARGPIRFRLFGGCCRASKRPTVSTRSGASCVHPANAGKNSRHGITVAVGEP